MENIGNQALTPVRAKAGRFFSEIENLARAHGRAILATREIKAQLEEMLNEWQFLSESILQQIRNLLVELIDEDRYFLNLNHGHSETQDNSFYESHKAAQLSNDRDWMNALVLVAKNAPVWMHQLEKKYRREIKTFAEIPDAELETMADQGITGIWLIGIWQRSPASRKIKQAMGAHHALASAYSLFDYQIADNLGGEDCFRQFKARAWQFKIRLGSDMVPNHTGIDSKMIAEHPDWFIQVDEPPYLAYKFSHENLSLDDRYEIRIEDHYYDRSDAAVVFEHIDVASGRKRYIYHGNDGTNMPWNDTAQLDFTKRTVRDAVIRQILRVAELTPIIRFDAAMTLTHKHFKRLWFNAGTDAIASRNRHAMSDDEFRRRMPQEFWREVVEQINEISPDTLLLAEAFWFTEKFFVKELGMHRVYNSAFMHQLRDEDNAKFGRTLAELVQHDSETLKRYTNFMNNPDEDSAATQFGKGDKYFGVTTLLATLPGLPMFGHGQIDGFLEKYGMEFERAMQDETPDSDFIDRHRREIFPLLKNRRLFAPPQNLKLFRLGDTNAFVYVSGGELAHLVMYNNQFESVEGYISPGLLRALTLPEVGTASCRELSNNDRITLDLAGISEGGFFARLAGYQTRVLCDFKLLTPPIPTPKPMSRSKRLAGLSLPAFSMLSSKSCGIGEFADIEGIIPFMQAASLQLLYILPVNDTGENPSPYSAVSAFALNPVFIRLDCLPGAEVFAAEIAAFRAQQSTNARIKYREVYLFKQRLLKKIFAQGAEGISAWILENPWISGYAKFKNETVDFAASVQMHLSQQLIAAKEKLEKAGILLKGDLPIMMERNSADVIDNPDLFDMQFVAGAPPDMFSATGQNWGFPIYNWKNHLTTNLAWWKARVRTAEKYFHAYRIDHVLGFFRIWSIDKSENSGLYGVFNPSLGMSESDLRAIRLSDEDIHYLSTGENRVLIWRNDIFYFSWQWQSSEKYYAMPLDIQQALAAARERLEQKSERKREELGRSLLSELKAATHMIVCAEDLGVVPEYVPRVLEELGIYGLRVDRWTRHHEKLGAPLFKAEEYPKLSIAMSSVHDSSTLRGYITDERHESAAYCKEATGSDHAPSPAIIEKLLRRIMSSTSEICLIPFQDFYALVDAAFDRPNSLDLINIPGQVLDANWSYRLPMNIELLDSQTALIEKIRSLVQDSGR